VKKHMAACRRPLRFRCGHHCRVPLLSQT
jgi:hypothetical protein